MLHFNNKVYASSIQTLNEHELDLVSAGGNQDGETVAEVAGGIAAVGAALAPIAPPIAAGFLAVAATTLLVAFIVEATEG